MKIATDGPSNQSLSMYILVVGIYPSGERNQGLR